MLIDVIGLGRALAAISLATRFEQRRTTTTTTSNHTFGLYRLEILAAFVNSLLLFAVAAWVIIEASRRIGTEPEVLGAPMLVVAVLGLVADLVAFALLRSGAEESVNVEGAYLEVLADTVGSVGVVVAAILPQLFGWMWVDSDAEPYTSCCRRRPSISTSINSSTNWQRSKGSSARTTCMSGH